MSEDQNIEDEAGSVRRSRREFLQKAAYTAPVLTVLGSVSDSVDAQLGNFSPGPDPQSQALDPLEEDLEELDSFKGE